MSIERVKGKIIANTLAWTCPVCNGKNNSGISKIARRYEESHNIDTDHKKLCRQCPKGTNTWVIVETEDG